MKTENENDPVWELLKSARQTKAAPSFVQDVMRQVRELDVPRSGRVISFFTSRQFLAVAAAVALMAVAGYLAMNGDSALGDGGAKLANGAVENVETDALSALNDEIGVKIGELEYVDDLLAVQDPVLLSDADIAMLLF